MTRITISETITNHKQEFLPYGVGVEQQHWTLNYSQCVQLYKANIFLNLTNFSQYFIYIPPEKRQKSIGLRCIEMEHWTKIG